MFLIIYLLVIYIIFFDISILDSIWGYDFLVSYVKGIFASAILLITLDKLKHIKFSDISVMMIIGGTILNYFYLSNTLNNHIGFILPWILVFLVPHLNINKIHLENAWKYFYIIFLIFTSFGLIDYYMIYTIYYRLYTLYCILRTSRWRASLAP